ncbi:MAG: carbohydrate binding family 9 domain-containing protein [Acidobacteria bacterium]|nr:carbohydrate binding family 9 domain-containing protein [Acidobacteriota bacterium]
MIVRIRPSLWLALLFVTALAAPAAAQQRRQEPSPGSPQKKTVTALSTDAPIRLDGVLDEPIWQQAELATDFVQREPHQGAPASERTEVRIVYDKRAIYFGMSAYDSEPDKIIIRNLEQDFPHTTQDQLAIYLDTFDDDRNSFVFYLNAAGAKKEMQSVDEGREQTVEWEDVWDVKTAITEEGWTAEVRIPFKSLRFPRKERQQWGINFMRRVRRKNEQIDWSPVPRRYSGYNVSFAGELRGLEGVRPGRNFKVKPFVTAQANQFKAGGTDSNVDAGLDVKYGFSSLTLDATLNTDFSQAEVDEQQINLTRFSLFFPEKRDFFVENAGIFLFGQTEERVSNSRRDFLPFFSRRIGLSDGGQPIPILGGARLTGRIGPYSLGILDMQTQDSGFAPATNFAVLRVKRNILAQSNVGGLWISREPGQSGDSNRTFGVDANFRFHNWSLSSFLAATRTPGLEKENTAARLWVEWKNNLWEARSGFLDIGENFNAEGGFVPRVGIHKTESSLGWRPRPRNPWVREFFPNARLTYLTDQENRLLTRSADLQFQLELNDGGTIAVGRVLNFERLDERFILRRRIPIALGDYNFNYWYAAFNLSPSGRFSPDLRYERGAFWDGRRNTLQVGFSFRPHYKFALASRYQWDSLDFVQGNLSSHLLTLRSNFSFSTQMFLNALIQYNNELRQISANIRFNLIHRPLSDIFIVYNEQRDTFARGATDKALSLKYTHMLDLF